LLAPIFRFDGFQLQLHEKHVMHGNSMMQEAQHICLGHLNVRHQQLLMAFMYEFTSRTCSEIFEMQRWQSFLDFFGLSAGTFSNIGRLYRNYCLEKPNLNSIPIDVWFDVFVFFLYMENTFFLRCGRSLFG